MTHTLARAVMDLDAEITRVDAFIEDRFRQHQHAKTFVSMPGISTLLGAELIACTGGDLAAFGNSARLAGVAGLAPVPKDSGRISGNMRRPHRYRRRPLRVFYLSVQVAARCRPTSPGLLPAQTQRGEDAQASRPRSGPTPPRRPMGPGPRPTALHHRRPHAATQRSDQTTERQLKP